MGSSNEANIKAIDSSIGGLVWVRRRNGYWVLTSCRKAVWFLQNQAFRDWYNLEKSKEVKAFRCGEYNERIEKAKAAATNPGKKMGKYVLRQDAILRALEPESICLGFGYKKDISGAALEIFSKDSSSISNSNEEDDEMTAAGNSSDLSPELSQPCSYFEE